MYNCFAFGAFAKGRSLKKCNSITPISVGFAERVSVRCKYLTIYRKDIKVTAREIRSLVIVAVLGHLVLCGSAGGSEPIEGLIAHWKFDEGEGDIAYDSAGDNDGTIYGVDWTTGIIDGALDFDGEDDYVDVGDPFRFWCN